jgi:hypothetical protein
MPNTLNAQQPSGEHKQTHQYQPLKPQWLYFPMRVFIFQALEKRLQLKCLVRRARMITEATTENI